MHILVYIEIHQNVIAGSSRELVAAARQLAGTDGKISALVAHANPDMFKGQIGGVDETLIIRNAALAEYNPEAQLVCLNAAIAASKPDLVLLAYTSAGMDIGPALSAQSRLPLASYCTKIERSSSGVTAHCQIYGGKLSARIDMSTPSVVMLTPGAYREDANDPAALTIDIPSPESLRTLKTKVLSVQAPDPNAIDITMSDRLVCVGRGIGGKDNIDQARELATKIGAEIAGSRPVIDAGWLAKERQVGKSGRKVKPRLYLALGVSGAPEHLEGMSGAELIVAINSDARAPIFDHAHYGAKVDLFEFIEAMTNRLAG
jgi:electron transfer flavoprotein alpha subunit